MTDRRILFSGEMQLARWSDSSTNGATVTFWVHPDDLESFKAIKARAGKATGQRLGVCIVEIGDDEEVVQQQAPAPAPRRPAAPLGEFALLSVQWCRDARFQTWCSKQDGYNDPGVPVTPKQAEELAKEYVLMRCGVYDDYGAEASRKHLDTDPECNELFNDLIRVPFAQYLKEHG